MKSCCPQWLKYLLLHLRASPILTAKHRVPFSDVSFALWGSPSLLIAYFTLLVIRFLTVLTQPCLLRSLLCTHSTKLSPPTSPCPGGLCPRDGMLACSSDLIHCGFVNNRCRGNCFFLIQIQGLEVQSRQTRYPPSPPLLNPSSKGVGS